MKILVTGGAGFVGSNLCISFKEKYPEFNVIALDNLKRRGSEMNIKRLKEADIKFIHGDIRNPEDLNTESFDVLIECSAEPSVLAGYGESPLPLINTNLVGTVNCLEAVRNNNASIIFLSSSRIYPYDRINSLKYKERETRFEWTVEENIPGFSEKGIAESFPLDGVRSMYGATKLSSELILREYINMYGIKGVINRCGVIAGPWQFGKADQGVFTLWLLAHHFRKPLKYIGFGGKGKQVRDLLHPHDLFRLIDIQLSDIEKTSGNIYNIGGGNEISLSLMETTTLCEKITGTTIDIENVPENRPADIPIYITDSSKAERELHWKPKKSSENILKDIYEWITENEDEVKNILI